MHFTDINIFARLDLYCLLDFKLCYYEVILSLSQLLKLYPDRAVYLGLRAVIMDTSGVILRKLEPFRTLQESTGLL